MENEEAKNEQGKAERFMKEFGKKLDIFFAEAKDASVRVEADLKKKYEELKDSAEKMKKDPNSKDRWKEVEDSLKKAGEELAKAAKAAFKTRP